jgi:hypothetical protein
VEGVKHSSLEGQGGAPNGEYANGQYFLHHEHFFPFGLSTYLLLLFE